jgi:hypothetical protein
MGAVRSDQDIRRAARTLGIDERTLRDLLNTADPAELLQRAATVVADYDKQLVAVAPIFGCNEKHLADAVWYLKENRAKEAEHLQRAAKAVVDGHRELADVAQTFRVNEKYLADAVWYMKQNREREERQRQIDRQTHDSWERYFEENPPS